MNKRKLFAWALYDWATSSFSTIVTTFIIASYFTEEIAPTSVIGTTQWGNAEAIAGVIIAICSPVFGSVADYGGRRKIWLAFFTVLCIISSALLWFAYPDPSWSDWTLGCLILGTIALEVAIVFYNAMLPSIAPPEYYGRVSGWAWALGYAGGLVGLIIALYGFVKHPPYYFDTAQFEHVRIMGPFVAVWITVFALPLLISGPDHERGQYAWRQAIKVGLIELGSTLKHLPHYRSIFYFLLARLFYIDGLNTVFAFGGIYARGTFGLSISEVIEFGIAMNVTAGLGAYGFAWVDDYWGAKKTILLSLIAIVILGILIVLTYTTAMFVTLALLVGLFFGPVQAASRSLMARLIPKDKANEFFGLYALSGKITAFLGPALLAWVTGLANSQRAGMASILLFFVVGSLLLMRVRSK